MKNRKLLLIVSLVLAMTMSLGGTLAYLTDTDGDVNVMAVGNVKIEQNEYQRVDQTKDESEIEEFDQGKTMLPYVVGTGDTYAEQTVDGWTFPIRNENKVKNYVDKIVNVTNTGISDAYVRTLIAIPEVEEFDATISAADLWLHWNVLDDGWSAEYNGYGWHWGKEEPHGSWPEVDENWNFYNNVTIDNKVYDVFIGTNVDILAKGATTAPSLVGIYLDNRVDCDVDEDGTLNYTFTVVENGEKKIYNLGDISQLKVLTLSQAVQADGFGSAWAAFDAAFPIPTDSAAAKTEIASWFTGLEPEVTEVEGTQALAEAIAANKTYIKMADGNYTTNLKVAGGSDVTIVGNGKDTVLSGQIATTTSTAGTLTLKNLTINVDSNIQDSTGISQTGKSAIAIWGNQTVICENVVFNMSLADSTAITSWWDTGIGTSIIVKNCTFNCNGQRPIRATGNVTVENCTFNDPYRYAVQLTAKASTATELKKAIVNFKNNTIVNGVNGKDFVYGIQLEGADYGCNNLVINGSGNTIQNGGAKSTMYYCECGKVDHGTVTFNTEVEPVHEN